MQQQRNATLRKGGPRAFWKRRRDDSQDDDDNEMTGKSPKRMKAGDEHHRDDRDDADRMTTNGGCLARTEALDQPIPGCESDHSLTKTNLGAQLSLSPFLEVVALLSTDLAKSDKVDQSIRGMRNNPDNPIVSRVKLDELEMLVTNMSIK